MARCLQGFGVDFIDTRDKYGRQRFFHFSGEDSLSLIDNLGRSDINWVQVYSLLPILSSQECCSKKAISFHHLSIEQMNLLEYLVYRLRPHTIGEEDLSLERSILPNILLKHSNILEAVLNIRNYTLRE